MAEKIKVFEAARELGLSEEETMRLLFVGNTFEVFDQDREKPANSKKLVTKNRTRMSLVDRDDVDALKRRLARAKKKTAEVRVGPTVVRRGEKVIAPAPAAVPVIVITPDQAALLSLQTLTGKEPPPARKFRVEIKGTLDGLAAIDVVARQVTPEWKRQPKTSDDLTDMHRAIAFGACGLLAQQREAAPKKESNPLGDRDARMREEITVKIQTKISLSVRKAIGDVISGRRGYSNVLKDSVAVRAHFARYHTGKGRTEVTPILRAAHRRGPQSGEQKARRYKIKA